jgi:hypothetical protein
MKGLKTILPGRMTLADVLKYFFIPPGLSSEAISIKQLLLY